MKRFNNRRITLVWGFFFLSASMGSAQHLGKKLYNRLEQLKSLSRAERFQVMNQLKRQFRKAAQDDSIHDRYKEIIITGNEIRVLLTNWGSISTPSADNSNADLVWPKGPSGLGYGYEFGPLVAAEVPHPDFPDSMLHIIDDGFVSPSDGDFQPGTAKKWGWQPRLGFSDPRSNQFAHFSDLDKDLDGKPDSWPEHWYNEKLGRYLWPAFLGDDATTPDEEVYYVLDDFSNAEYPYYPFPDDSSKRGLGLELQVRIFQFNNPLAEDMLFIVYTVTNTSPKTLEKVYLGMFGDPHVGGPRDYSDDFANFISAFDENFPFNTRNMLYAYDEDGKGDYGKPCGYFGYRFLESPGISDDGFDNDNDGLVDESPFNNAGEYIFGPVGIYGEPKLHWSGDEDGDWDPDFDDVGVDGIAGTGDFGEGDGKPNQLFFEDLNNNGRLDRAEPRSEFRLEGMRFLGGEPNFGFLDIAESDQLGLTSFNAILYGGNNRPNNDPLMWRLMSTPNQRPEEPPPQIEQNADNVFIYSSGPFRLKPGESQRFSIVLLLGQDLDDLLQNAEISQQVFEADYRFAKPPIKPKLVAVPGDGKVTLYWDTGAEQSFDPFVARANPDDPSRGYDFEGYRIYRSQDFSFNDTKTITDSRGVPFLSVPLKRVNGVPAQFDLINEYSGLCEIEYKGRGARFYLGNNTGLVHSFVDSNNVINGLTYFYAVTSYDHGDVNAGLPPSESQRTIKRDALTRQFTFDVNTAMVVPGPPAAGYVGPQLMDSENGFVQRVLGNATGIVRVEFLNPFSVIDGRQYQVVFEDVPVDSQTVVTGYSVIDLQPRNISFVSRDTIFVNLPLKNLVDESVIITDASGGVVEPTNYILDPVEGRIRAASHGSLPEGQTFQLEAKIRTVAASTALHGEDTNPVFDGMKLFVEDDPTQFVAAKSGFKIKESNTNLQIRYLGLSKIGKPKPYPADFEIQFVDYDTTSDGQLVNAPDTSLVSNVAAPFRIIEVESGEPIDFYIGESRGKLKNRRWDYKETIILFEPGTTDLSRTTYQVTFTTPSDTIKTADGSRDSLIVFDDPVYPKQGDVFLFFSTKPFESGDQYSFTTRAVHFDPQQAKNQLDEIYVVPNPYIAYSASEVAAPRAGERDNRRLEFRNLPPRCTIRIYTITGELVDTIEKDDTRDFATWDLLTFESQQTAYGVYIYHVDAPGIGTRIGRFALIK